MINGGSGSGGQRRPAKAPDAHEVMYSCLRAQWTPVRVKKTRQRKKAFFQTGSFRRKARDRARLVEKSPSAGCWNCCAPRRDDGDENLLASIPTGSSLLPPPSRLGVERRALTGFTSFARRRWVLSPALSSQLIGWSRRALGLPDRYHTVARRRGRCGIGGPARGGSKACSS